MWQGRRLALFSNVNGEQYAYTYNADGIRISKQIRNADNALITGVEYIYNGSKLVAEIRDGLWMYYVYDETGAIAGLSYNGVLYLFRKNLQGDVTGIYNANGALIAEYSYTPYGEILAITDANGNDVSGNSTHIANINPIRYRGYYYDTETGFYYLQSRYYDPTVGRFINADAFVSTGQGIIGNNMFAYCLNNPVLYSDVNGKNAEVASWLEQLMEYAKNASASMSNAVPQIAGIGLVVVAVYEGAKIIDGFIDFYSPSTCVDSSISVMPPLAPSKKPEFSVPIPQIQTKAKEESLIDIKKIFKNPIYFGVDLRGDSWKIVTPPMSCFETSLWILSVCSTNLFSKRSKWGLYTLYQDDAYLMALSLSGGNQPIWEPGGRGQFDHYHTSTHNLFGWYKHFHVWYGSIK